MVEGVVAHDVALLRHAADDVRSGLHHVAHHEEGGRGAVLFQGVQNGLRVAVFISAVKGQVEDLLAGVPQVVGVVLGQVLRGDVARRGFSLRGEGQPPVRGGGHGSRGGGGEGWSRLGKIEQRGQSQA